MSVECALWNVGAKSPTSMLYLSTLFKATLPMLAIATMVVSVVFVAKRKRLATSNEQTQLLQEFKAGIIVFVIFLITMLHPRCAFEALECIGETLSAPPHPGSCQHYIATVMSSRTLIEVSSILESNSEPYVWVACSQCESTDKVVDQIINRRSLQNQRPMCCLVHELHTMVSMCVFFSECSFVGPVTIHHVWHVDHMCYMQPTS